MQALILTVIVNQSLPYERAKEKHCQDKLVHPGDHTLENLPLGQLARDYMIRKSRSTITRKQVLS